MLLLHLLTDRRLPQQHPRIGCHHQPRPSPPSCRYSIMQPRAATTTTMRKQHAPAAAAPRGKKRAGAAAADDNAAAAAAATGGPVWKVCLLARYYCCDSDEVFQAPEASSSCAGGGLLLHSVLDAATIVKGSARARASYYAGACLPEELLLHQHAHVTAGDDAYVLLLTGRCGWYRCLVATHVAAQRASPRIVIAAGAPPTLSGEQVASCLRAELCLPAAAAVPPPQPDSDAAELSIDFLDDIIMDLDLAVGWDDDMLMLGDDDGAAAAGGEQPRRASSSSSCSSSCSGVRVVVYQTGDSDEDDDDDNNSFTAL